jgi:hypothetical protein
MYRFCLFAFIVLTLFFRLAYLESYPFGFSGHAIGHSVARIGIYKWLFVNPLTVEQLKVLLAYLVSDQHAPQSLLEAILTPIFGFGLTGSRVMVSSLGLLSVVFIVLWGTAARDKWLGLCLGMSIGLSPYFLYFSRNGDSEHVNIYLQGFLLFYAAQRVIGYGKAYDFVLLGLATGWSLWVYATNQALCAIVISSLIVVAAIQYRRAFSWKALLNWGMASVIAAIIMWPQIASYIRRGRPIPVRTPYGNPAHEVTSLAMLPSRYIGAWQNLFSYVGDPWFTKAYGPMVDYSLILLVPGIITMIAILKNKSANSEELNRYYPYRDSWLFLFLATLGLTILGVFPGILSPESTFRRLVLTPIGLDIIKGIGLYGVGIFMLRRLPRRLAVLSLGCLAIAYSVLAWDAFYYQSSAHESNSTNSLTAVVREMSHRLKAQLPCRLFLPNNQGHLARAAVKQFLTFDLGLAPELPPEVKFLDVNDLNNLPLKDVIVPAGTLEQIERGNPAIPPGIGMENIRLSSNRAGRTVAIVDFVSRP